MKANTNAWFGKKRIGWGIGPRSWQGWLVIAIYTVMMLYSIHKLDAQAVQ